MAFTVRKYKRERKEKNKDQVLQSCLKKSKGVQVGEVKQTREVRMTEECKYKEKCK